VGAIAPVRRLTIIIKYLEVKTEKLMFFNVLRTFTKRYPFHIPRASLLERLPNVPDNFGIFQSKSGIRYVAYPNGSDFIVKNIFWLGDFDPWVATVLKCLAHPDEVVCDIGAYIGDTSLPLANCMGSLGHIYCFEPVPLLYECLEKNVKANSISCITSIPLALSDRPGKLKLDPGGDLGMSQIVEENQLNSRQNSIEVNVTTFDLWMKDSGIAQVAVVKIDVEDHELEVLKGMKDTLSKHHIGSIVFERRQDCDTTDAVVQLLQRHGYRIFRIYKGILKTEVVELGCSATYLKKTYDYVAVIENSEFERRLLSCPTVRLTAKSRVV